MVEFRQKIHEGDTNKKTKCWVCGNVVDKEQPVNFKVLYIDGGEETHLGHSKCYSALLDEWQEITRKYDRL